MCKKRRTISDAAFSWVSKLLAETKLLVETADTTAGIDHLLLAGEEGMALSANFNTDILLGGAGGIDSTAGAADGGLLVVRMDSCLHGDFTSFKQICWRNVQLYNFTTALPKKQGFFEKFQKFFLCLRHTCVIMCFSVKMDKLSLKVWSITVFFSSGN